MPYYYQLPKYCKLMTKEELQEFFPPGMQTLVYTQGAKKGQTYQAPKFTNALLMRTLIMNELEHCNSSENRTLRAVWYAAIKPTLDKLGMLQESDMSDDGMKRWDNVLSKYVCDLLRDGYLTFSDLGISDISRQKRNPSDIFYNISGEVYSYQGNASPYPNIIIATEKDTVYSIISSIAKFYGCSAISCQGQNSLGAAEVLVKGIMRRWNGKWNEIIILTMTDYDPAGYYIAEALEKQVYDILNAIGHHQISVRTHRIGITPDQLTKDEVYQNMYSPKKANLDKWMERTGGIDGLRKGLELDAFTNKRIREIFIQNLKQFVSQEEYLYFIKSSFLKKKLLEYAKDKVNEVFQSLQDEFLEDVEVKEFDIHDLAMDGDTMFHVEQLCYSNLNTEIKDFVEENL